MVDTEKLFIKADKEWDKGNLKNAFELFLEGAEAGDESCQNNLGVFYDCGYGIRKNPKKALYWYKKAIRKGSESSINNIANYYYKQGNPARAKVWHKRSIKSGDGNAALDMAKIYLGSKKNKHNTKCALKYLKMALKSGPMERITPYGYEEAEKLLVMMTGKIWA